MKGGVMDGKVYSFSVDVAASTGKWAEHGVSLDVFALHDRDFMAIAKLRISGWPEHDYITFHFNKHTLVQAKLHRGHHRGRFCDLSLTDVGQSAVPV
jgi:hypothetical protein